MGSPGDQRRTKVLAQLQESSTKGFRKPWDNWPHWRKSQGPQKKEIATAIMIINLETFISDRTIIMYKDVQDNHPWPISIHGGLKAVSGNVPKTETLETPDISSCRRLSTPTLGMPVGGSWEGLGQLKMSGLPVTCHSLVLKEGERHLSIKQKESESDNRQTNMNVAWS